MEIENILSVFQTILKNFGEDVSKRKCNDQKVCEISIKNTKIDVPDINSWDRCTYIPNNKNKIVIILESPHKDEFNGTNVGSPASGATGRNISKYLKVCLLKIIKKHTNIKLEGNYDLILMNSLQQQCSMGFSTSHFRTLSFIGLWYNGGV